MTTKDHAKLVKKIEAHLLGLGAIPTPNKMYHYCLQTPLGQLDITVNESLRANLITIFTCFDKPALAVKRFRHEVNEYSGKWNHHFDKKSCTPESIYSLFTADLEKTRDAKAIALSVAQWQSPTPAA